MATASVRVQDRVGLPGGCRHGNDGADLGVRGVNASGWKVREHRGAELGGSRRGGLDGIGGVTRGQTSGGREAAESE